MNYKSILFFLGIYSLFISFFAVLNILYSIYFEFILGLNSYLITLAISLFIGIIFCYLGRYHSKDISLSDQIIFIVLSFILIPFLISIPYSLSIYNIGFLNAYFESVSGLTTTGFTILKNIKLIDEPLLLWRSSSQWLGGLFFLIAIIATIGSKQIKIKPIYLLSSEVSGRNFYKNFNYNFIRILGIYFSTTLFVIFVYNLMDLRLLDSFNMAFTTVSSGGFIPSNNLSNIIINKTQTIILSFTLLIPILNFYLLFNIFTKQFTFKKHLEDIHIGSIIILLTLLLYFFIIPDKEFADIFLAITSSVATSGITTYSSNFGISLFLILLAIMGGSLISASSGFKYIRFYILYKVSYQEIYRLVKPINIFDKNLFNNESKIDDQDIKIAFLAFITFIISAFVLSGILTLDNINFESSFKLSLLTLTNTVASSLYDLDNLSFFDLNSFSKISLVIFMILGKIEIITLFYLMKRFFFKG